MAVRDEVCLTAFDACECLLTYCVGAAAEPDERCEVGEGREYDPAARGFGEDAPGAGSGRKAGVYPRGAASGSGAA